MEEPKLQKEVADKYDLVKIQAGSIVMPKFGHVDLTKLDVAAADKLVAAKFPYLKLKPPVADTTAPPAGKVKDTSIKQADPPVL